MRRNYPKLIAENSYKNKSGKSNDILSIILDIKVRESLSLYEWHVPQICTQFELLINAIIVRIVPTPDICSLSLSLSPLGAFNWEYISICISHFNWANVSAILKQTSGCPSELC